MSMKDLVKTWRLPNIPNERIQVTLRLPFDDYARLHALKEVYPRRSVNDIISDIIRIGLDEIIVALPSWSADQDDVDLDNMRKSGGLPEDAYLHLGEPCGPAIDFEYAYRRILESKAAEEKEKETTA